MTNTISAEQFERTVAIANKIGEHFAKEPDREKVLVWLSRARNELIEEIDWGRPGFINAATMVDRLLDIIEARRAEVISARGI